MHLLPYRRFTIFGFHPGAVCLGQERRVKRLALVDAELVGIFKLLLGEVAAQLGLHAVEVCFVCVGGIFQRCIVLLGNVSEHVGAPAVAVLLAGDGAGHVSSYQLKKARYKSAVLHCLFSTCLPFHTTLYVK